LPRLLERAGTGRVGSITGLYTVLVDGDDENDPVADNARAILDGHLFLSRRLAGQAVFPAIDPTMSVSRLAIDLQTPEEFKQAASARELWGEFQRVRDLVEVGAYRAGTDPRIDRAIALQPLLVDFIRQEIGEVVTRPQSLQALSEILAQGGKP
jgi:flagellum-specific ATP synthase